MSFELKVQHPVLRKFLEKEFPVGQGWKIFYELKVQGDKKSQRVDFAVCNVVKKIICWIECGGSAVVESWVFDMLMKKFEYYKQAIQNRRKIIDRFGNILPWDINTQMNHCFIQTFPHLKGIKGISPNNKMTLVEKDFESLKMFSKNYKIILIEPKEDPTEKEQKQLTEEHLQCRWLF